MAVNAKHDKRRLRQEAWAELQSKGETGNQFSLYNPYSTKVKLNFKKLEWGKPGKYARIVCDLGTTASIRAGWLAAMIKDAMSELPLLLGESAVMFIKSPDIKTLSAAFQRLSTTATFLYFSDDASFSIPYRASDGTTRFLYANADIAGCDASQGPSVFQVLPHCCPTPLLVHMHALIEQCARPAQAGNGKRKIIVEPVHYFEYSGSVLTTLLNNIATSCIGYQLYRRFPLLDQEAARAEAERRLKQCGWSVTVEWCETLEEIQFLKCSPFRAVSGELVAVLNLGVILRSLGQKSYDLPGHGPLTDRGHAFNCSLVAGLVHSGNTSLYRLLRTKFLPIGCTPAYNSEIVRALSNGVSTAIADYSICRRYKITLGEYEHMLNLLDISGSGDVITCAASRAIMLKDYGL